jgi:hypothetical protein
MRNPFLTILLSSLILGATSSCSPLVELWLVPGSTLQRLTIAFGMHRSRETEIPLAQFEVVPCAEREETIRARPGTRWTDDERTVWQVRAIDNSVPLSRITYGEVPTGFQAVVPATPLGRSACYFARVRAAAGGGELVVIADAEGFVRQLSESEKSSLYDSWRDSSTVHGNTR